MSERHVMILGGLIGACAGAAAGFVFFTPRGRRLRRELQPEIDVMIREAMRLTHVVDEVKSGRPATQAGAAEGSQSWPRRAQ
jgi:gas vesicle protein